MISQLLGASEREVIKDQMIAYGSFMTACHRLNHIGSKPYEGKLEDIQEDLAAAGKRLYDLQRETGIVMFLDLRSLMSALLMKSVDEDCRVAS